MVLYILTALENNLCLGIFVAMFYHNLKFLHGLRCFREELEKQRAAANYQRLHAKGKTEEARADLARLAIIKAQREEAAKKRAEDAKSKNCFVSLQRFPV